MAGDDLLQIRRQERAALLERIDASLRLDERVVAAWLGGSLGRRTADAWSDIDVWVIVADEHSAAVNVARRQFVAAIQTPALIVEAPENAPPGGAYLLVLSSGRTGAHQVDWYWQPRSSAWVPNDCRLLFDRVGLPSAAPPAIVGARERAEGLTGKVALFWLSVLLTAKAVARGRDWAVVRMIGWTIDILAEIEWLLAHDTLASHDDLKNWSEGSRWPLPAATPSAQLALVREIAAAMNALAPEIAALGGQVPDEGVRQVQLFLDLATATIEGTER